MPPVGVKSLTAVVESLPRFVSASSSVALRVQRIDTRWVVIRVEREGRNVTGTG